ncbi:GerAB/ArcD/ProY family transporter [Pontibacillus litoralis]|uniref:Spore germination protein n=1 Tax=Pontibacillus litoralis JSM 072002 TaxID=1385512 RepID=A0A0A5HLX0_9BACI|nr:endospore germination permease [Pontibacillus litoralis]KGX84622.1 spore germination protein [Pontibacillus litoralis JSM 072002]
MTGKEKISLQQFMLLVILFNVGSAIIFMPSIVTMEANRDAWLSVILAIALTFPAIIVFHHLAKRFPFLTMVEYSEMVLGKWIGKLFSLMFLFGYIALEVCLTLFNIGSFLTTHFLIGTPIEAVYIVLMTGIIIACRLGLEVFSRTTQIIIPILIILVFSFFLSTIPLVKFQQLQPILEDGIGPVISGSLPLIGFPLIGSAAFLMIFPNLNQTENRGRTFYIAYFIAGFLLFLMTILCILVLGADGTRNSLFPTYEVATKIKIGQFIQRIEALISAFWFVSTFVRLIILYYVLVIGIAKLAQVKQYKPFTLPLGMWIVAVTIIIDPSNDFLIQFDKDILWLHAFILCFVLPMVILVVAKWRKLTNEKEK